MLKELPNTKIMRYLILTILTLFFSCQLKTKEEQKPVPSIQDLIGKQAKLLKSMNVEETINTMPAFNSLLKFELLSYNTKEEHSCYGPSYVRNNQQIFTNANGDTTVIIRGCELHGKSILELYQYAFQDLPLANVSYPADITYINSREPAHLYNLHFMCSTKFGNYHEVLVKQLNNAFHLQTTIIGDELIEIRAGKNQK